MLHATPVAKALKRAMPDCEIIWIATPSFAPILEHNPYVDEILLWARDDFEKYARKANASILWNMWWELRRKLLPYKFDLAIDVQGLLISGLVLLASGAKRKLGMANTKELNGLFNREKNGEPYRHVIDRYLNVAHLLGVYSEDRDMVLHLTDTEIAWAKDTIIEKLTGDKKHVTSRGMDLFSKNTGRVEKPLVILVPGTSWHSKEWLPTHWRSLIEMIKAEYRIIYIGGQKEVELASQLPTGEFIYNAVGKTSIRETAALINEANCVISCDTGSLHMAAALKVPTVNIFGPTDPTVWGVLDDIHTTLQDATLSCLNCRKRRCPKEGHPCMRNITPEMVRVALKERIAKYGKIQDTEKSK